MKCKDCKFRMDLTNTEECRQAICSFPNSYCPICIDNDCLFTKEKFKCKDCINFYEDTGCISMDENDEICCGFMSIGESKIVETLIELAVNGKYSRGRITDILNDFELNIKPKYDELYQQFNKGKESKNGEE